MRACAGISLVLLTMPLLAGERMTVSVCIQGHLGGNAVMSAEGVAAALFRPAGIEIVWAPCDTGPEGDEAIRQHWFTLRLRNGQPFIRPSPRALDTLGEAFFSIDDAAYIVEVYYEAVETLAASKLIEPKTLLGCVMAHELGHLLLGPGHAPSGIMRAAWDAADLNRIRQGRLHFNPAEDARMRRVLQGTVAASSASHE